MINFDRFLEAVKLQMQPEGRAQRTAGMHQHLRTLLPHDVTLAGRCLLSRVTIPIQRFSVVSRPVPNWRQLLLSLRMDREI